METLELQWRVGRNVEIIKKIGQLNISSYFNLFVMIYQIKFKMFV